MERPFLSNDHSSVRFVSLYTISSEALVPTNGGARLSCAYPIPAVRPGMGNAGRPSRSFGGGWQKGVRFPTCAGVGFQTSRPFYEPLLQRRLPLICWHGPSGRDATCISTSLQAVSTALPARSRRWRSEQRFCHVTEVAKGRRAIPMPGQYRGATLVREKPRYVDVTIEGVGTQRVWFDMPVVFSDLACRPAHPFVASEALAGVVSSRKPVRSVHHQDQQSCTARAATCDQGRCNRSRRILSEATCQGHTHWPRRAGPEELRRLNLSIPAAFARCLNLKVRRRHPTAIAALLGEGGC